MALVVPRNQLGPSVLLADGSLARSNSLISAPCCFFLTTQHGGCCLSAGVIRHTLLLRPVSLRRSTTARSLGTTLAAVVKSSRSVTRALMEDSDSSALRADTGEAALLLLLWKSQLWMLPRQLLPM